jgi:hypothetical protein
MSLDNPAILVDLASPGDEVAALFFMPLVILLLVVVIVLLPGLLIALELAIVGLIALLGLAGRLLFRRPWRIEAVSQGDPPELRAWHVVGLNDSLRVLNEVSAALRLGRDPAVPAGAVRVPATR